MSNHRVINILSTLGLCSALLLGLAGGAWAAEPADASPIADENARFSAADTNLSGVEYPVLHAQISGTTVTLVEGDTIDDTFWDEGTVTQVVVTIALPTSLDPIVVTTISGPTWTELTTGEWQATFPMPDIGASLSGSFALALVGGPVYDPTFTVNNKNRG